MTTYRLLTNINSVYNTETQSIIPADSQNTDWQDYITWLSEGNVPDPPVDQTLTAYDSVAYVSITMTGGDYDENTIGLQHASDEFLNVHIEIHDSEGTIIPSTMGWRLYFTSGLNIYNPRIQIIDGISDFIISPTMNPGHYSLDTSELTTITHEDITYTCLVNGDTTFMCYEALQSLSGTIPVYVHVTMTGGEDEKIPRGILNDGISSIHFDIQLRYGEEVDSDIFYLPEEFSTRIPLRKGKEIAMDIPVTFDTDGSSIFDFTTTTNTMGIYYVCQSDLSTETFGTLTVRFELVDKIRIRIMQG